MDTAVWIVLIIAVTVIVVLFMFRPALKKFFLKANQDGIEAGIETRDAGNEQATPPSAADQKYSVNISHNKQVGASQNISVGRPNVNVSNNTQAGHDQSIEVKPTKPENRT
jgi:hypothetical protein